MKYLLSSSIALGLALIVLTSSAKNKPFTTTITVKVSRDNELHEKIGLWYCTDPDSYERGKFKLLTQLTRSFVLKCRSFGFFPADPTRIQDKNVNPARIHGGLNTFNHMKDSYCKLAFNDKTYKLISGQYVNIPQSNILSGEGSNNIAEISCKR